MDPGQPEQKRPRLDTPNNSHSWTTLPQPAPSQHPPPGSGPYQHQPYTPRGPPDHPPHPHTLPPPQHNPGYANDRRHHDQEPYTPLTDHYRQPASPARPHNYTFPPRDPGIKREMYDEQPQPRRPHSTGGAPGAPPPGGPPDGLPHPPPPPQSHSAPSPHAPPPPHYQDDRRHMGYDAPQPMPITPGGYRTNFPPPPPPPPPQPPMQPQAPLPYDPHAYQPPPGPEPTYSQTSYSNSSKKKATRASQACEYCRQLKAKCDETKPCKTCREKGQDCVFRESVPKPSDKSQADILDGINELKKMMELVNERIGNLERAKGPTARNVKMEHDADTPARGASPTPMAPTPMADGPYPYPEHIAVAPHAMPQPPVQHDTPQTVYTPNEVHMDVEEQLDAHMEDDDEDDSTEPPGPNVRPGQPSIPHHHTTSASLLLAWPSIKRLTQHMLERENIFPGDFPQRIEERRGIPRLYGRGEGHGRGESAGTDYGHLEVDAETYSEPGSSPAGDWGQLGSMSPQTSADYKSATLNSWGQPDYTPDLVWRYLESFQTNVLSLHPIVYKRYLRKCAKRLLQQTALKNTKPLNPGQVATFISAVSAEAAIGKRKRSPTSEPVDKPASPGARPGSPSRSIETAVILAALALGKLSLHKGKISDVTPSESRSHNSPIVRNGHPASPAQTSPPAHSQSSGFVSPRDSSAGSASRRPSWQGSGPGVPPKSGVSKKRNYESIPGLEYLGPATDIVGNQDGGVTIQHVQANILIALYYGQIGYVVQSLKYISNASWTLQVYMRRDLPRLQQRHQFQTGKISPTKPPPKEKLKDHLLLMTFWTCLQLESDIVVELNLPRSGILSYEEGTPYPTQGLFDCEERVATSYLAQLYIRKNLNYISKTFYSDDPGPADANGNEARKVTVNEVRDIIRMDPQSEFSWLPPEYRFNEREPPASDMLSARLRAKYWGFQVICMRPFVKMILDFSCQLEDGLSTDALIPEHNFFNLNKVDAPYIKAGTKTYEEINPAIVGFAQEGISALIESTRAFHNLGNERLLLTNFFGTAIAQWGNLMVLAACYRDPFLGKFVDQATLRSLFERTVSWISRAAQPSSSLAVAIRMLEELRDNNFAPPEAASVNRSFSSSTTGGALGHLQQSPVQPVQATLPPPVMTQSVQHIMHPPHAQM